MYLTLTVDISFSTKRTTLILPPKWRYYDFSFGTISGEETKHDCFALNLIFPYNWNSNLFEIVYRTIIEVAIGI